MEKGYRLSATVNYKDGRELDIQFPSDYPILNGGALEDHIIDILKHEQGTSFVFTVSVAGEFDFAGGDLPNPINLQIT